MHTREQLMEMVSYEPDTGIFRWKHSRSTKVSPGDVWGTRADYGRIQVRLDGKTYRLHRVAWLFVYGEWPAQDIDHINGNPADNRISNLRLATDSQNLGNAKKPKTNKSGKKGVSWHAGGKKWQAHIKVEGDNHYLGLFNSVDDAHAAYMTAAVRMRGEFARAE